MNNNKDFQSETTVPVKVAEKETHRQIHQMGDWVLNPAGKSAVYGGMIGAGVGFALTAVWYEAFWIFIFALAFVFGGAGGFWMLNIRLGKLEPVIDRFRESITPQDPPRGQEQFPVFFDLKNGRPGVTIYQPRPQAFRAWLKAVISENGRTQFSKNQAKERGFLETYDDLIAKLKSVGLLHESKLENMAPAVTDWGRQLAKDWLDK